MFPLPTPATDPILLADWVELCAFKSADGNYSMGDLERALESSGVMEASADAPAEEGADPEAIATKCVDVFHELEARAAGAAEAYPFTLSERGLLQFAIQADTFSPYMFCLCLSYFRVNQVRGVRVFPRRLFEDLSCAAARNYVDGKALRFASPRADLPRAFRPALHQICTLVGEGTVRERPGRPGNAKLDVVAWRDFPDKNTGKLLLFGQCASGIDWDSKLGELQPETFCGSWLSTQPVSRIIRAFFTPHRISATAWEDANRAGGLFFDRCRLAYWVNKAGLQRDEGPFMDWYKNLVQK